jgi:hypothetical protein
MIAPADSSEGGKKRTAISPYDPSFITLLRLSLSPVRKKKRLTMSKRVSTSDFGPTSGRHYTISLPTFFFVVDAEEFEFIPCRIFPWPHDRLHTQVHTPFTQYMLTTKCRDRELLHPCSPVPFSISPLEESETVVMRREKIY